MMNSENLNEDNKYEVVLNVKYKNCDRIYRHSIVMYDIDHWMVKNEVTLKIIDWNSRFKEAIKHQACDCAMNDVPLIRDINLIFLTINLMDVSFIEFEIREITDDAAEEFLKSIR